MNRHIFAVAALAAALGAVPASAAHFVFTASGVNLTFDLPDSPTVTFAAPGEGFAITTPTVLNGNPVAESVTFLNTNYNIFPGISGGFSYDGSVNNVFQGAQLYSGAESAPTFLMGTFNLTQYQTGAAGTLVISESGAVPEPASWALMLGGFGLVGGAMRSRRKASVSFA